MKLAAWGHVEKTLAGAEVDVTTWAAALGCCPHTRGRRGVLPWLGPPCSLPPPPGLGGGLRSTSALDTAQGVLNRGNSISNSYTGIPETSKLFGDS